IGFPHISQTPYAELDAQQRVVDLVQLPGEQRADGEGGVCEICEARCLPWLPPDRAIVAPALLPRGCVDSAPRAPSGASAENDRAARGSCDPCYAKRALLPSWPHVAKTARVLARRTMEKTTLHPERRLSVAEELANSVIHALGLVASLVALPVLVVAAAGRADAMHVVGCSVFAASLIALYAASTIYHALPPSRVKQVFRVLDHVTIYLLIAGTYTPFTLGVLRGAWGWTLFGIVWSLAAAGIVWKTLLGLRYPRGSTVLYLMMGWLAVVAIRPITAQVPAA